MNLEDRNNESISSRWYRSETDTSVSINTIDIWIDRPASKRHTERTDRECDICAELWVVFNTSISWKGCLIDESSAAYHFHVMMEIL